MLRTLEEKRKRRLDAEYGEGWRPVSGGLRVGLVYPNKYAVGMSNLGFQTIYHLLNQRDDVTCERIFLPDPEDRAQHGDTHPLYVSLESATPLSTFDILAFSVSFEMDYLHVVTLLRAAKIPPRRVKRTYGRHPLVFLGGIGVSINPEPLADFADAIFIGEAEEVLGGAIDAFDGVPVRTASDFEAWVRRARCLGGVYFPHAYTFHYDRQGRVQRIEHAQGYPARVQRQWVRDLDRRPTVSRILTPETELNDMFLVELDRGCGRHCRFCAAGYLYRPPRFRSRTAVLASVRQGLGLSNRIGLVGTAVSDYPQVDRLCEELRGLGVRLSVSSLRADALSTSLLTALAESGHKTLALAPEAGSQRLRNVINKTLHEAQILEACTMVFASGIPNLKLYFMIGLPFEEEGDLAALVRLVRKVKAVQLDAARGRGRIGRITVSVNIFVPKPNTPFQWFAMNKKGALSKKISYIKKNLRQEGNIRVVHELPKWSLIQALLARGDRRLSSLLISVAHKSGNWSQALAEDPLGARQSAFRPRDGAEILPWDVVEAGCRKEFLLREWERSAAMRTTESCPENLKCKKCGVCDEGQDRPDGVRQQDETS